MRHAEEKVKEEMGDGETGGTHLMDSQGRLWWEGLNEKEVFDESSEESELGSLMNKLKEQHSGQRDRNKGEPLR